MKVLARIATGKEYLPLFDDDEMPAVSVKVQVDGLEITILRRPGDGHFDHGVVDIRVDPISGQAVGIEHEHSRFDRTQVHLQLIADDTGRGLMP